jgi:prepilin-type N-terminal cleavage/methylation domain-containing protein
MMPISSVGAISRKRSRRAGVTLIEMMIVVTIIALVAGLTYPSIAAGFDSLRLRSASNSIVSFLDTALDRADRRQQVVEIRISPRENALIARSADLGFVRRLDIPDGIHIAAVTPAVEGEPDGPRRFLVYPGGAVPRIGIELINQEGRHRSVSIDPVTGVPAAGTESQ